MKKTILCILFIAGLIRTEAAVVGIGGNYIEFNSIWSGNSDYIYLATFSQNHQIDCIWEWGTNYIGSASVFGNATGVLYSEDRNTLISYINQNNFSLNGFYF
jgi:hypothetical protein